MIRIGTAVGAAGVLCTALPSETAALCGFVVIGLGFAPIYPSIIHSTPVHFGAENSQAVIGVQMASAYVGSTFMPPLFGLLANHLSIRLLPPFLAVLIVLMIVLLERSGCREDPA